MMEMRQPAILSAKLQSNYHHQHAITQTFLQADALPVAQPTVSVRALKGTHGLSDLQKIDWLKR